MVDQRVTLEAAPWLIVDDWYEPADPSGGRVAFRESDPPGGCVTIHESDQPVAFD